MNGFFHRLFFCKLTSYFVNNSIIDFRFGQKLQYSPPGSMVENIVKMHANFYVFVKLLTKNMHTIL